MSSVIAIDGPAASGKSSTAALVAQRLGWAHLDSGALYRAVTLALLDHLGEPGAGSGEPWASQRMLGILESLPVRLVLVGDVFRAEIAGVDVGHAIRGERVTRHVSAIAAIPQVRTWVNAQQRRIVGEVTRPGGRGVVVDGRDIGTVVFPDAPLKVFLTAAPAERARRRLAQRGDGLDADQVRRESAVLAARDAADSTRPVAPLQAAADAVVLDSTTLTLAAQVEQIVQLARRLFPG